MIVAMVHMPLVCTVISLVEASVSGVTVSRVCRERVSHASCNWQATHWWDRTARPGAFDLSFVHAPALEAVSLSGHHDHSSLELDV